MALPYSTRICAIYYLRSAIFACVRFPCATRKKLNAEFMKGGWELWSYFKPFVDHKFTKFSDNVGSPSYFPTPFSNCLCHVSFRRYIRHEFSKSLKNQANAKVFWPPIFVGGTAPTVLQQFVGATYLAKFGWVPFADLCLRSLAMKENAEFTEGG